jgi:hypothetical protein
MRREFSRFVAILGAVALLGVGCGDDDDGGGLNDAGTDTGVSQDSAVDDSAVDDSAVDDSAVDDSAVDDSAVDDSAVDDASPVEVITTNFATSLHKTRKGMETWYLEEEGGFEQLTDVDYDTLACKNCHDKTAMPDWTEATCADCHKEGEETVADATCLGCHSRQGAERANSGEGKAVATDVHLAGENPLSCSDCHSLTEMHGDGNSYDSQFDEGAMTTSCTQAGCHETVASNSFHNAHQEDGESTLSCSTCHMQAALTCANCHFDSEVDGLGKFARRQVLNWRFLINRNGKVDVGTLMTLKYTNESDTEDPEKTFAVIAPYYAHTIAKNAVSGCGDCHNNLGSENNLNCKSLKDTGALKLMTWNAGESNLDNVSGIIPVPPNYDEAFTVDFADITARDDDNKPTAWEFLEEGPDLWQMITRYGSPLTADQMAALGCSAD